MQGHIKGDYKKILSNVPHEGASLFLKSVQIVHIKEIRFFVAVVEIARYLGGTHCWPPKTVQLTPTLL